MSAIKNIWADLVDKRLWPLALVLVAALVAVPVLLAKPAPSNHGGSPQAAIGAAPSLADPTAVATGSPGGPVSGRFKDPFKQLHLPKVSNGTSATISPPSSTGSSGTSQPASTGTGGGDTGGSGSSSSGGGDRSSDQTPVLGLRVRFGPSGGRRAERELSPGQPLPNGSNPLIVFLQVGKDSRTAAFLVSSDAKPQGDGQCKPSLKVCSTLLMQPGETEFFDVTTQKGTKQYQLDVLDVVYTS